MTKLRLYSDITEPRASVRWGKISAQYEYRWRCIRRQPYEVNLYYSLNFSRLFWSLTREWATRGGGWNLGEMKVISLTHTGICHSSFLQTTYILSKFLWKKEKWVKTIHPDCRLMPQRGRQGWLYIILMVFNLLTLWFGRLDFQIYYQPYIFNWHF